MPVKDKRLRDARVQAKLMVEIPPTPRMREERLSSWQSFHFRGGRDQLGSSTSRRASRDAGLPSDGGAVLVHQALSDGGEPDGRCTARLIKVGDSVWEDLAARKQSPDDLDFI